MKELQALAGPAFEGSPTLAFYVCSKVSGEDQGQRAVNLPAARGTTGEERCERERLDAGNHSRCHWWDTSVHKRLFERACLIQDGLTDNGVQEMGLPETKLTDARSRLETLLRTLRQKQSTQKPPASRLNLNLLMALARILQIFCADAMTSATKIGPKEVG